MPVTRVLEVDTHADLEAGFRELPHLIYAESPVWAGASENVVSERFEDAREGLIQMAAFLALSGDQPVARAAAIMEPAAAGPEGRPEGWIGLFECSPGASEAGVAVLESCESWLSERGMGTVVAPRVDGLRAGLLIDGFDQPHSVFTAHNPPHYLAVYEAAGFAIRTRMLSFVFTRDRVPSFPALGPSGIGIRSPDPLDLSKEFARIHSFQETVFAGGSGHLRRDRQATERIAQRLLPVIDPDLVLMAERSDGSLVGFILCLPDVWQASRPIDRARLVSVGVVPGLRGRGIAMAMGAELARRLLARDYRTLEGSWVLESNRRPQVLARRLGSRPGRTFALLAKRI